MDNNTCDVIQQPKLLSDSIKALSTCQSRFVNSSLHTYLCTDVVDTELGKEITAGWIINDLINVMKAKIDLKAAFHLIPVRAVDWVHLGMDRTCLPFGLCSALSLINNYADALHWIMASNYGAQLLHYLDNFLLVGPPSKDTSGTADRTNQVLVIQVLYKAIKRELLSLIGKLFFAKMAPAVRLFLCRLIDLSTTVRKLHHIEGPIHLRLTRLPLTLAMLSQMLRRLERAPLKQHDCLMIRAALALGFFSFLRVVKFTMKNRSFNPRFHPTMQDISWSREGMRCFVKQLKTDQMGRGATIYIGRTHQRMGCHSQPMFFHSTCLHLIEQRGFDAAKFITHSLCIGAASTAARAGLPSDTIQKLNKTTALYVASEKGDYEGVKRLLGAGAKVNEARSDDGCSPLYAASCNGHLGVVKTLLEAGANINQVNKYNTTPLYVASEKGHHDIVQTLLGAGADVNIARSDDGRRPLYIASLNGHLGVVKTLMEAGANINQTSMFVYTVTTKC
ncbi:hypothetical protein EMCRGX_G005006 [Ephydatia muelleri]